MWIRCLSLVLILSGCGVFAPEKRMQRICVKNPEVCEYERIDTQITIREYQPLDTQKITNKVDSFIIEQGKTITRIYRSYDTITVNQIQKPDTVRTIIKERSQVVTRFPEWVKWAFGALGLVLLLMLIIIRIK